MGDIGVQDIEAFKKTLEELKEKRKRGGKGRKKVPESVKKATQELSDAIDNARIYYDKDGKELPKGVKLQEYEHLVTVEEQEADVDVQEVEVPNPIRKSKVPIEYGEEYHVLHMKRLEEEKKAREEEKARKWAEYEERKRWRAEHGIPEPDYKKINAERKAAKKAERIKKAQEKKARAEAAKARYEYNKAHGIKTTYHKKKK